MTINKTILVSEVVCIPSSIGRPSPKVAAEEVNPMPQIKKGVNMKCLMALSIAICCMHLAMDCMEDKRTRKKANKTVSKMAGSKALDNKAEMPPPKGIAPGFASLLILAGSRA